MIRTARFLPIAAIVFGLGGWNAAQAAETSFNQVDGYALHGFDPVAYFTDNKPVKGSNEFASTYDGVTFLFSSADHKKTFDTSPTKYLPEFGGFCAHAVAEGVKADIDPHAFTVSGGKLYVNYSEKVLDEFKSGGQKEIDTANHNWSDVSKQTKVYH